MAPLAVLLTLVVSGLIKLLILFIKVGSSTAVLIALLDKNSFGSVCKHFWPYVQSDSELFLFDNGIFLMLNYCVTIFVLLSMNHI